MSRTIKAKAQHRDWWGKRPLSGLAHASGRMRWWKRHLHKIERRAPVDNGHE
jgi:hypothetical protein